MASYQHELIEQLARHCTYTPRQRRFEQMARIQALLPTLDDAKTYPYDYAFYRVFNFRPDEAPHAVFDGKSLRADLVSLVLDISDSLDLPVAWAGEPVMALQEVCRTYDVSLKTVRRWRAQGLVALRLVFADGRKRAGVRQRDLEAFVEAHPRTLARSAPYAHIDAESRRQIIARAFELSLSDELTPDETVGRLAREFTCPHEPVRELLEAYDAEHPEAPIFGTSGVAISDDDRRRLLSLYRNGLPAGELARQFLVGRTTVGRVVRELIVDEVLGQPWEHVHCPAFDEPDAAETVLADAPVAEPSQSLTEPLKGDEEQVLFRQYNFLKWQLAQARDELSPSDLSPAELERLAHVHDRAMAVRNRLVLANLRLVIHLAKRHLRSGSSLDELVSDGTVSLMQAIERFDYSRGVRFSTYSSWAILKNYAKSIPRELRARSAVTQDSQEIVEAAPDASEAERNQSALRKVLRSMVTHMLLELGERERQILVARFGLGGKQTETLEQIGQRYDITRERVRQIEARALRKLAAVADPELLEELAAPASSPPH